VRATIDGTEHGYRDTIQTRFRGGSPRRRRHGFYARSFSLISRIAHLWLHGLFVVAVVANHIACHKE
jgi:hypothetical protein